MIARAAPVTLLLIAFAMACGPSQRQRTLRVTYTALNAVADGVVSYSRERETEIVNRATSLVDGETRLKAHRETIDAIVRQLIAAYRVLAAAAVLDAESTTLETVTAAALAVQRAWAELRAAPEAP